MAMRSLFGRAPARQGPGSDRSVAAPDMSWDDADHQAPQAQDDPIVDPWEHEGRGDANPVSPPSDVAGQVPDFQPPTSTPEPGVEPDQIGADPDISAPSHGRPVDWERVGHDQGELVPGEDVGSRHEVDEGEDWEALEDAVEDLFEVSGQTGDFAVGELADDSPAPLGVDDADRLLVGVEQEVTETDVQVERSENRDETLDKDWDDEETDWTNGFEAFGVAPDRYTQTDGDFGLYDYDEEAQQRLWDLGPDEDEAAIRRARAKAAAITSLLEIESVTERNAALHFLTELFEHLRHPSTYRAVQNLAADGLDFETLQAVVALRRVWMQRTDWWLYRYRGEVCFLRHGAAACTWILAHRVCVARWQFSPETMVDEEWLDEWLTLPAGAPGYFRFSEFIAEKVDALDAETLHTGLLLKERSDSPSDLSDDYDWHRRVPDRYGVIGQGFSILTPYDDRPGVIRLREDDKEGD